MFDDAGSKDRLEPLPVGGKPASAASRILCTFPAPEVGAGRRDVEAGLAMIAWRQAKGLPYFDPKTGLLVKGFASPEVDGPNQ